MAHMEGSEPDIYPLHLMDAAVTNHTFPSWIMRFNDVLDADKLHGSLLRLLEIGDWRKLGGRLRLKENGIMEVHVPKRFTPEQPAITFTHIKFLETKIQDHEVARLLPAPTDGLSIQPIANAHDFSCFAAQADFPKTIREMMERDLPQLSLCITSFSDATLVSLAWPHTMMDAVGQQDLLKSWSLVLAGREAEVPIVLGARDDVLTKVDGWIPEKEGEKWILDKRRLGALGALELMFRLQWSKYWDEPRETRVVCLPSSLMEKLRSQAREENDGEFVSDGDLITALAIRAVTLADAKPRPVTAVHLLNGRYRIPWLRKPDPEGIHLQNIVLLAYSFIKAEAAAGSAPSIALANRKHLAQQATESQITLFLQRFRNELRTSGKPNFLYGESSARVLFFNNLLKPAFIQEADFSPAVVRLGEPAESRKNPPGRMVNYFHLVLNKPYGGMDVCYVLGKDYAENYWVFGSFLPKVWARLNQDLEELMGVVKAPKQDD